MKKALKKNKSFKDLSGGQRLRLAITAALQIALQAAALKDLKMRPAALVNGPKPLWFAVSFINFFGPVAYFVLGRKR